MSSRGAGEDRVNHHFSIPKSLVKLAADQLPPGVSLLVVPPEACVPEFIRLPSSSKGERCAVTGLSYTAFVRLLDQAGARIRTHMIRGKGATRGITMVHRQSLIDYISSLPARTAGDSDQEEEP